MRRKMHSIYFAIFFYLVRFDVNANEEEILNYRLHDIIKPSHYLLEIKTYIVEDINHPEERFNFDGIVKITLSTTHKYVDKIFLNAKNLNITKIQLKMDARNAPEIFAHISEYNNNTEKICISLKRHLEPAVDYFLELTYTGKMEQSRSNGFYLSSYVNDYGEEVNIGATQFRPNFARMAFPCFDEPKFKATFQLRINRENRYHTTSNTKISHTIPLEGERSIDVFNKTPIMSTFGLAFLISDFKYRKDKYENISVLAPSKDFQNTEFAMSVAQKLLHRLNEYTEIAYTSILNNEKLDLIASPKHISNGMTHFGFISFREDKLIRDLYQKNVENEGNTIICIAHQIAQTWFGSLVTPEWWTYNWLSEGLSAYVAYIAADEAFPEYDFDNDFVTKYTIAGLYHDSYKQNPLVNRSTENFSDLSKNFNIIVQQKGPAIIRMIAHLIGPRWFKITLQNFLRKHTVTNEDFLKIFREDWLDQEVDLKTLLADWTEQVGYPLVTVHLSEDGYSINVSQKRFLDNTSSNEDSSIQYTIPFTYTTNIERDFQNTRPKKYLQKNTEEAIDLNHKADWVVANIQLTGYYRINYDQKTWLNLKVALKSENFGGIHVNNRAQIVGDILQFGYTGLLDYKLVFEILEYLEKEDEYLPWREVNKQFYKIFNRLNTKEKQYFKKYELKIVSHVYEKLTFYDQENDRPFDIYNRAQIRDIACKVSHSDCILKAKDMFDDLIENKRRMPSRMQATVFCTAAREYGEPYSSYLWNLFISTGNEKLEEDIELALLTSLACTQKKEDIFKLLDLIVSQDKSYWTIVVISSRYENIDDIIQYFVENQELIIEKKRFLDFVESLAHFITTDDQLSIMKEVINDNYHITGIDKEVITPWIESIEKNLHFNKQYFPNFEQYLEDTFNAAAFFKINFILISILIAMQIIYNIIIEY